MYRHDNVKRTIETLAAKGLVQHPQSEEVKNHLGQTVTEYLVGKRDSYVIVAQLSPEFTARLVDRWQELETQVAATPALTNSQIMAQALLIANSELNEAREVITGLMRVETSTHF